MEHTANTIIYILFQRLEEFKNICHIFTVNVFIISTWLFYMIGCDSYSFYASYIYNLCLDLVLFFFRNK